VEGGRFAGRLGLPTASTQAQVKSVAARLGGLGVVRRISRAMASAVPPQAIKRRQIDLDEPGLLPHEKAPSQGLRGAFLVFRERCLAETENSNLGR